jgi:hypothetical protein
MNKSLFSSVFAPIFGGFVITAAFLASSLPIANAQPYYGQYSYAAYGSCENLTLYQGPGSTDAQTGGQVSMLQEFLNQTGYLSGVSGTYDNGTLGAVINFQRAYNLPITGTVTQVTLQAIDQQSCGAGIGGYGVSSYPVTNYSGGSNCYWTGSTYNSTYVCSTAPSYPVAPIAPIQPQSPYVCNNWNSNNYTYYSNSNYCNGYGVELNSLSVSYSYNNTATITITGYGFSTSGNNTVYFGNTLIGNAYSSNGTTLVFTVPVGYTAGTYDIRVTNASGASSNSLAYILSNSNNYNNNYEWNSGWNNGSYNNGSYNSNPPSLSNISGSSIVSVGSSNTWAVTATNSTNYNYSNTNLSLVATWGDGSSSNSQQAYAQSGYNNSGSQTYNFTHVYQTPGTYTLTVTATNSSGRSSSQTFLVTATGYNGYGYYNQSNSNSYYNPNTNSYSYTY